MVMENIKLVIWDLDETFWKGTLSDGEIFPIQENIDLVKNLTDRGIVNSICSKNDFSRVKEKLEEMDVWDYFVFPSIDWTPKGNRVLNIISDMNLRSINCLFVDDNVSNLEEVKFIADGNINVTLPEQLSELISDSAFAGKDDREHTRLKQYKVLEEKNAARARSVSTEEFLYQSHICVEMIEDCHDQLERIHEMIHRNNQLNFTKNRISQEDVNSIFTDSNIRSGYVKVKDKYGDHGIVGCYAVKGGIVLQLVFSCRILGMGIEQYVYAMLDFPKIKVVGEVATQLNETDCPEWINQSKTLDIPKSIENIGLNNLPKLIMYGACPIRPVWAYVSPILPNAEFADIAKSPISCNLAVGLREERAQLKEWTKKVAIFDSKYTFNSDILDGNYDYLLFSLYFDLKAYVYTNHSTGAVFYSDNLTADLVSSDILESYEKRKMTLQDIENEMVYLAENIPANKHILLLTVPEVVFPELGKDNDYNDRIALNVLSEKIAGQYSNVYLIDMRKYAVMPSNFRDNSVNHYNREIGYKLAKDVLRKIGINTNDDDEADDPQLLDGWRQNAKIKDQKIVKEKFSIAFNICNGRCHISIEPKKKTMKYTYTYQIIRNGNLEYISERSSNHYCSVSAEKTGKWHCSIGVYQDEDYLGQLTSPIIEYTPINYAMYINPKEQNYSDYINIVGDFINNNQFAETVTNKIIQQISLLAAQGINIADYFLQKDINEISIFVNNKIGNVLIPFLKAANIRIAHIYTIDSIWEYPYEHSYLDGKLPAIEHVGYGISLSKTDHILIAYDYMDFARWRRAFGKITNVHYILEVLEHMMTQKLFIEKINKKQQCPKVFVVRCPRITKHASFPYYCITANEKKAEEYLKNNKNALYLLKKNGKKDFPEQFSGVSVEELMETLVTPKYIVSKTGIRMMADCSGNNMNIDSGFRRTIGTPSNPKLGKIHLLGDSLVFGCGVSDEQTIASYLQTLFGNKYKVCNCSNFWSEKEFDYAISYINKTKFENHDIIVILLDNYRLEEYPKRMHWLNWSGLEQPITKVDAYPLFMNGGRSDYFLLPNAYNAECNQAIAQLIYDTIEDNSLCNICPSKKD